MGGIEDVAPPGGKLLLAWRERAMQREQELGEAAGQVACRIQVWRRLVDGWIRRDHRLHLLAQNSSSGGGGRGSG